MFPEIPADLSTLSSAALRTLAREVHEATIAGLADGSLSTADAQPHLADRNAIRAAIPAALAAEATARAELEDDHTDDAPAAAPAPAAPAASEAPAVEAADGGAPAPAVAAPAAAPAAAPVLSTTFGQAAAPAAAVGGATTRPRRITADLLRANEGVPGKNAGDQYENWTELAQAAIDVGKGLNPGSGKHQIAGIKANYAPERILSDNVFLNLSKFEPDEMMAALCAPATPYYDLACMNTLRRPVFGSLPQFQAPRGKVSIQSSPQLSDITNGVGVWSAANEASTNAVKSACQTITCGTTTEYQIYGIYRCLTVRNLLAMTYPEFVEAWLNRLSAAHARLAEQTLLNAMGTAATAINAPSLGYGATQALLSTILTYIALYQETQRWDISAPMEGWLPRWVQYAIKTDMMRRRSYDGSIQHIPSDAAIDQMFANVGVNIHWFIDTPTWSSTIPPVATGNTLNRFPVDITILLSPPGKLAVMDRGELSIGVTGNGIYRDNNSNARNEFTFFFENFEGIVNTTSCPAHLLTLPQNCFSGVQIDDIVINCQGGDEGGYQS